MKGPRGFKSKKGLSKKRAKSQMRLLRAIEHGWKPSKRRRGKK